MQENYEITRLRNYQISFPLPRLAVRPYPVSGSCCSTPRFSVLQVMIPFRLYTLVLGGSGVLLAAYLLLRRKPRTTEDIERERRAWLDRIGRITDGTVIDVQEIRPNNRAATMLIYQYDVAGVSYEASQDVTYLRHRINLHSCRLGLPTSVRYDPQNPGNSIVVSERWMGLRQ
jgi:uncharacterized protein DUF3592